MNHERISSGLLESKVIFKCAKLHWWTDETNSPWSMLCWVFLLPYFLLGLALKEHEAISVHLKFIFLGGFRGEMTSQRYAAVCVVGVSMKEQVKEDK